jgi:hypothetical protein
MRYVGPILAAAAARIAVDEVLPQKGVLQRDFIPFLTERYQFNLSPPTGIGVAPSPILTFGSGVFDPDGERIPIVQSIVFPDGCVVIARETNYAERILEDLMAACDNAFGYRYGTTSVERLILSQITVEFDDAFVQHVETFQVIQSLVNHALHREQSDYRLKRLSFGRDTDPDLPATISPTSMDHLMLRDFLIERRAGLPMDRNLFFCSAPMETKTHIETLGDIERAALRRT